MTRERTRNPKGSVYEERSSKYQVHLNIYRAPQGEVRRGGRLTSSRAPKVLIVFFYKCPLFSRRLRLVLFYFNSLCIPLLVSKVEQK